MVFLAFLAFPARRWRGAKFRSSGSCKTISSIRSGVSNGRDANSSGLRSPLARQFTWEPPMSTTRTYIVRLAALLAS